ncbi:hypothetical protein [Streptomyces sp. A1499]|uniref:hypothetical protein n=1 Tax=Streptomyces sp. A1499 TaxID=2563104 RepID=UPI00109E4ECA|nr:hypothetical protein [Streptomyces sp. A1499]THC47380.1 hypothetical protein E7X58_28150 [Streptomyces sp. A1499]
MPVESTQKMAGIQIASNPEKADEKRDEEESEARIVEEEMKQYKKWMESRDELIKKADQKGMSEVRIASLMGHSRNTVRKSLHRG